MRALPWIKRNLTAALVIAVLISAVATYFSVAGDGEALRLKPKRVLTLLLINLGLLALIVGIVSVRIFRLWSTLTNETTGSRLQKRILALFSIVAVTPMIIVSIFSTMFFNVGIQTWFNERVQTAVSESLAVAEAYLAEHKENIRVDALAMAGEINQYAFLALTNPSEFARVIGVQASQRVLTEAMVFQHGRIIAQGRLSFALAFEKISEDMMERADGGEVVILPTENDKVRALVKIDTMEKAYLLVGRLIDARVATHMKNTQGAVSEYNNLERQLERLQWIFSIIFIMLSLVLLLSSLAYGMVFASRLTTPIARLVAASERVRSGDFSARVIEQEGKDEITLLSRSFNRMTEQLDAQRTDLIEANRRLDERRRFSEAVLAGVSAGVIALDRDKRVAHNNRSALAILGGSETLIRPGAAIAEILPGIQETLMRAEHLPSDIAQTTLALDRPRGALTLHVRVAVEKLGEEIEGFIVTFDDITQLVSAQRTAAWADVARRVAHEIKNPLTPIQLSAERLKRKYLKYITEDQETFVKYTDTIVKQVSDIGRMVEEFVSFARMPNTVFADEDLAALVKKAVFTAQLTTPSIEYRLDLPETPMILRVDERQIAQVLGNVLKNAAESIEAAGVERGVISAALVKHDSGVRLLIEDNGIGFPTEDPQKMLEPYVTTRSKGTGLGLAIVKKIMDDHRGTITLERRAEGGARVNLFFQN